MRKPFTFSFFFAFAFFLSLGPGAQALEPGAARAISWEQLEPIQRSLVDAVAADFFEETMRFSQTDAIEANTGETYRQLDGAGRVAFRTARRAKWRAMGQRRQAALRQAEKPTFDNLTDVQKEPFRGYALDRLNAPLLGQGSTLAMGRQNDV